MLLFSFKIYNYWLQTLYVFCLFVYERKKTCVTKVRTSGPTHHSVLDSMIWSHVALDTNWLPGVKLIFKLNISSAPAQKTIGPFDCGALPTTLHFMLKSSFTLCTQQMNLPKTLISSSMLWVTFNANFVYHVESTCINWITRCVIYTRVRVTSLNALLLCLILE